ncbi:MAG TPA: tetratricopeptide repeat protein [Candidatus Solibacter sp.]|nr:tetratricopeptide repeat protein [Candidatus Solibacter sp.]
MSLVCLLAASVTAQNPNATDYMINGPNNLHDLTASRYATAPGTAVLEVNVFSERNGVRLDRQAVLRIVDKVSQATIWETADDKTGSVFPNIPWGDYAVEVSAVGYLSTHKDLKVLATVIQIKFDVVLQRDPSAVDLDVDKAVISPKVRKEVRNAIVALKSGKLDSAQKHLDQAFRESPSDPNLNFLLGYLYFQRKDYARAMSYLSTSTSLGPHNPQALTLLGRTGLERKDYPAARSALEQAVLADEENWLPHNLLADTYLREKNYTKARDEAQVAIAKGKAAASPAELVLGEALANLGHSKQSIEALNSFLAESPQHPIAGQVRSLIADLEERSSNPTSADANVATILPGVDPLAAIPAPRLSVKAWQPPGVDDIKLNIAPDVACPTERVIEESGKRVQELVDDVARFAAIEDLFHQSLDEYGNPVRTQSRKFNYVASISEPEPGYLAVDEYRADKLSLSGFPDNIASTGFAALALVLHPHMRDSFELQCEGLGDWHGQAAWLIHFRQRDDRPNRMHSYKVGNQFHAVKLKGRAWITADKFQMVRIEAEMIGPMPEIQLLSEHQVVEYGPVPFQKKNATLWLPKSAEIYFDFRRHHYYRRHSFDHYMLYSVDTQEKRKEPSARPEAPPAKPEKSS